MDLENEKGEMEQMKGKEGRREGAGKGRGCKGSWNEGRGKRRMGRMKRRGTKGVRRKSQGKQMAGGRGNYKGYLISFPNFTYLAVIVFAVCSSPRPLASPASCQSANRPKVWCYVA